MDVLSKFPGDAIVTSGSTGYKVSDCKSYVQTRSSNALTSSTWHLAFLRKPN